MRDRSVAVLVSIAVKVSSWTPLCVISETLIEIQGSHKVHRQFNSKFSDSEKVAFAIALQGRSRLLVLTGFPMLTISRPRSI